MCELWLDSYASWTKVTVSAFTTSSISGMKSARYWWQEFGDDIVKFYCDGRQLAQDSDPFGERRVLWSITRLAWIYIDTYHFAVLSVTASGASTVLVRRIVIPR